MTLLAPAVFFNKLLFIAVFVLSFKTIASGVTRQTGCTPLVVMAIFFYGFLLSFLTNSDQGLAVQFVLVAALGFLIEPIKAYKIDLDELFISLLKYFVVFSLFFFYITVINRDVVSDEARNILTGLGKSASASKDYFADDSVFVAALSTVPWIFIPWCILVARLRRGFDFSVVFWLLMSSLVILISGRRALIVVSLFFLVGYLLWTGPNIIRVALVSLLILGLGDLVVFLKDETYIFSLNDESNSVKIGHLASFVEQLGVSQFIFGHGLASYYHSAGVGELIAHTELTPIDSFRYFGVPLSLLLYGAIVLRGLPMSYEVGSAWRALSFLLYLILSCSNPVLFNSYGMLVVLWYWSTRRGDSGKSGTRVN
jgi:hypothetical protein